MIEGAVHDSDTLTDLIFGVVEGDLWHGSSTAALLDDVTAAEAAMRPVPGGHSIWELVVHHTVYHSGQIALLKAAVRRG